MREGRLKKARVAWQTALEGQPAGSQCLVRVRRVVPVPRPGGRIPPRPAGLASQVRHDRAIRTSPERTGRACLLLPASGDELRQAVALVGRAAAADLSNSSWAHP